MMRDTTLASAASAPGKLMIAGEYAVLEGAPALAMAISRRARASLGPSATEPGPLHLAIASELALDNDERERLVLDSSDLFDQGRKQGFGSSAALCVAATSLFRDGDIFEAAHRIHRRFQSQAGSGYDIAASTYGGAFTYVMGEAPRRVELPRDLFWKAFDTGESASTVDAIGRWHRVRDDNQKKALLDAANSVAESVQGNAAELIGAVSLFQSRLLALDRTYSLAISSPLQESLEAGAREIAEHSGSALVYKQSGAGGGDIGLALASNIEALQAFTRVAVQSGLQPLDLSIDMQGVKRD